MSLFPALGPTYYTETDKPLLSMMEATYAQSITIGQSFWSEADLDSRFYVGDQTVYPSYYGNLPIFQKRQFQFNITMPQINMVSGYQRRNRKSISCIPIQNGDNKTASQYTKIFSWANQREGILDTFSDACWGSLVTGMNLMSFWMDYRSDPVSGDIKCDNASYNEYLIDPFFQKSDLSDCNFVWKRKWMTPRQVISILPERQDEILSLQPQDYRDGKFQFMPQSYNYGMRNLLTYDEYWYRDFRKQKCIVDTVSGESLEWKFDNDEGLELFLRTYPQLTVIEQEIPTTRLGIVVQGKVMWHGPNPMGIDRYPFVPVFCYFNPQLPYFPWRIQGMVRTLRDTQFLYNRFMVNSMDIMESQINSGYKYKENALVNPADIFMSGQGKGLALKEEAQMTDVEKIQPAQAPVGHMQMAETLAGLANRVTGVNDELMGSAVDDKAGILSMLRQGAGLTTLQPIFDQWDSALKLCGTVMLDLIQANFTPGKVKLICKEEPQPIFYKKAFGVYDCAIEEGLNTTTQRQTQFAQLLELQQMGIPIPMNILIQSSTLQNKDELLEGIMQSQQGQQQMEQLQMSAAVQEQQARTDLAKARAVADRGLGLERVSRIEENRALAEERRAEAVKDQNMGALDFAKAAKELEGMDLEHLQKLVNMTKAVKEQSSKPASESSKSGVDRGNNLAGQLAVSTQE